MSNITTIQLAQQCYGPGNPRVDGLIAMLKKIPAHHGVRGIAINGQTGAVYIQTHHEDAEHFTDFDVRSIENEIGKTNYP